MSDYILTPASVVPSANATLVVGTYGGTVNAGQPVYQSTTAIDLFGNGKFLLAQANGAQPGPGLLFGIATNSGANNQPAQVCIADPAFTHGLANNGTSFPNSGQTIIVSINTGQLCPDTDLAVGSFASIAMVGISTTQAVLRPLVATAVK
jgi:hypothetical protein